MDNIDSKAGKLLYQAGMGVADAATTAAITALTGTTIPAAVLDFSQSAADAAWDIQQRGGSNRQILIGGLAYGTLDAALGQIPMDKLLKTGSPSGAKQLVKQMLQQGGVEATEEMVAEVAHIITDTVIMGEDSETKSREREYMAQGMSEEAAKKQAVLDNVERVILSGAEGFVAGMAYKGIIGGIQYTAGQLQAKGSAIRQSGQTAEVLQRALDMPADSPAYQMGTAITEKLKTELMKAGFDSADFYQQSRADQLKRIDKVVDDVLTDEAMGNLSALVEGEQNQISRNGSKDLENGEEMDTMKIGFQFFAEIPEQKFAQYALNPQKDPNKAKAFKETLGYDLSNYQDLMTKIEESIDESKFVEKGDLGHGMRYEYIIEITGPNGKSANVLTAWIDDGGGKRLTSVYVTKKEATR